MAQCSQSELRGMRLLLASHLPVALIGGFRYRKVMKLTSIADIPSIGLPHAWSVVTGGGSSHKAFGPRLSIILLSSTFSC